MRKEISFAHREYRRITPESEKEIERMLLAGDSYVDIGYALDLNPVTVMRYSKKHGFVAPKRKRMCDQPCSELSCNRLARCKGYCISHYNKYRLLDALPTNSSYSRRAMKVRLPESLRPRCDHSTSKCDCPNRGKMYVEYAKEVGFKVVSS